MTDASPSAAARKTPDTRGDTVVATVRDTATKAADSTASIARDVAEKTSAGIEANPLAVLAGGVALGILAGAFAPRSAQETKLLAPVGKRLSDTARGAMEAAKDTAKSEFDVLGLTRNAARDQVGKMLGDLVKALTAAGTAALSAANAVETTEAAAPASPAKKPAVKKAKPQA